MTCCQICLTQSTFAIKEGQSLSDDICYLNYALGDMLLELLYGDNLNKLQEIKVSVDLKNVMRAYWRI